MQTLSARGAELNLPLLDWVAFITLSALAFFAFQPFEMGPEGAGIVTVLRGLATAGVGLIALTMARFRISSPAIIATATAGLFFLAVNAPSISPFGLAGSALIFLSTYAAAQLAIFRPRDLQRVMTVYVVINITGFLFAWMALHLFGINVDLHHMIYPFSQARLFNVGSAVRITGLHIEPGTYAQWTFMALLVRSLIKKRLIDAVTLVGLITIILTLSAWAILAVGAYAAGFLLSLIWNREVNTDNFKRRSIQFLILVGLISAFVVMIYYNPYTAYLQHRYQLSDASGLAKVISFRAFMNSLASVAIIGKPINSSFCPACLSPQDVGVWSSFGYYVGILPSLLLGGLVAHRLWRGWGPGYVVAFAPTLITKTTIIEPLLWFLLTVIIVSSQSAPRASPVVRSRLSAANQRGSRQLAA